MKLMKRNLKPIWYCLYEGETVLKDEDGYETGEKGLAYSEPVKTFCNVSPATGYAQTDVFGNLESYDKVVVVDNKDCPIDENTVLFIDKEPEFKDSKPVFDYTVRRVAKSLNHISYAVSKVKTS